jgi:putative Mn2+ efflux pump MntP
MKRAYKKIFKTKRDYLFMKKRFQRKILSTFAFSIVVSVLMIVHGIFLDLDFSQIKRLSLEGFIFTFVLVFIGLLILEKIFNLEEDKEIIKIKKRLNKLEKKK